MRGTGPPMVPPLWQGDEVLPPLSGRGRVRVGAGGEAHSRRAYFGSGRNFRHPLAAPLSPCCCHQK